MLAGTFIALSVAGLVAAQDVTVQVGALEGSTDFALVFSPSNVTATKGSVITFQYSGAPGNHSVTQSSFDAPCTPLENGFDSGYVFRNPETQSAAPEWNLTITDDSTPIWLYCKQLQPAAHCVAGMVFAINAPTSGDRTVEAFQSNARAVSADKVGTGEGLLVGQGASASAGPGPIASGDATFGVPAAGSTPTAASGSGSASAPAASESTTDAALGLNANMLFGLLSASALVAMML